jgi:O-methyltransferase domain
MVEIQDEPARTELNPVQVVLEITGAYALPRCLHVVAELGVADVLDETPRTGAELAEAVSADADALGRVLRLLAAHGIFATEGAAFTHTPASRLLRTDHPQSMRAFARMFGLRAFWDTQRALMHSVRTGRVAAEEVLPTGFYGYLAEDPQAAAIFNAAMVAKAHGQVAGVLAAYDFSSFGTVGDIGGGRGHLLRAILEAVPSAQGVLYDLPRVIEEVQSLSSNRVRLQPGDFLKDALPVCDAYILMEVVHVFGEAQAVALLQAIRQAAPPHAPLLVIEQMIPDDPGPHWAKTLDIHMLALLGGRQRSQQDYVSLLEQAGFAFKREIDTRAGVSILEAVAV